MNRLVYSFGSFFGKAFVRFFAWVARIDRRDFSGGRIRLGSRCARSVRWFEFSEAVFIQWSLVVRPLDLHCPVLLSWQTPCFL